jgi:ribose transport system permease protein
MHDISRAREQTSSLFIKVVHKYGFLFVVVLYILLFGLVNPKFLTLKNITNVTIQMVPLALLSLGVMFVLISGGLDLTAGVGVSLAAVAMEEGFRRFGGSVPLVLVFGFAVVLILGIVNGLLVSKLKIESIIVTLIMMTIVQGAVFIIVRLGTSLNMSNPLFEFINRGRIAGIPNPILIMVVIYAVSFLVLNYTRFGHYLVAIGSNPEGARRAGINVYRLIFFSYIVSGFVMGLVAVLMAARLSYVTPNMGGTPLFLDAIAAAIIGGVAVGGGKGTVQGVLIGSVAIAFLNSSINLLDIHPSWSQFFKGFIIVLMMLVNKLIENMEVKSKIRDRS